MQGPSPDEVALVEAAKRMGFVFVARARSRLQVNMLGRPATFEILNTLDFTSDRARYLPSAVVISQPQKLLADLEAGFIVACMHCLSQQQQLMS